VDSFGSGYGSVTDHSDYGNEQSGSMKGAEKLEYIIKYWLIKNNSTL
jgi:hypothetical protein